MKDLHITTGRANSAFHKRAGMKMSGGVKPTHMGMDLSMDATNVIPGTKATTTPLAPNANSASQAK